MSVKDSHVLLAYFLSQLIKIYLPSLARDFNRMFSMRARRDVTLFPANHEFGTTMLRLLQRVPIISVANEEINKIVTIVNVGKGKYRAGNNSVSKETVSLLYD